MVLIKVFCYNSAKYEANFIIFFLLLLEMQSKAAVSQICLQTGGGGKCRIVHAYGHPRPAVLPSSERRKHVPSASSSLWSTIPIAQEKINFKGR